MPRKKVGVGGGEGDSFGLKIFLLISALFFHILHACVIMRKIV